MLLAPLTINVRTPIFERSNNSTPQQGGTPYHSNITSQQHTRYFTLTNTGNINNNNQEQTAPEWLIECTCLQTRCQCHAKLRPDILCIIRVPKHTPTPLLPSHTKTIQFIEFTYCHDRFPEQAITQKHAKYDPLTNAIQSKEWKTKPLITITAGVRGAIHKQSIKRIRRPQNLKV